MAEGTLAQFHQSVDATSEKHGSRFHKVVRVDTTSSSTQQTAKQIADETLASLQAFTDENIALVPAALVDLPPDGSTSDPARISAFLNVVSTSRKFMARSLAEENPEYIQPIAYGLLRYNDQVLLLKRKKPGHSLHNTQNLWAGGHVSDKDDGTDPIATALEREIAEEIFIRDCFEINREPVCLLRTNETERASRHIGVLFEINIKNSDAAAALEKEFRETRSSSMEGRLVPMARLHQMLPDMKEWSKQIVAHFWPAQLQDA